MLDDLRFDAALDQATEALVSVLLAARAAGRAWLAAPVDGPLHVPMEALVFALHQWQVTRNHAAQCFPDEVDEHCVPGDGEPWPTDPIRMR